MAVLTSVQRTSLNSWRTALEMLNAERVAAVNFVNNLVAIDEQTLLDGSVTFAVDWWPDKGDDWNDLRQRLIDAAEAIPEHEA